MFLTGPGVVREVMGEDVRGRARRPARARPQRRLPLHRADRRRRGAARARPARLPAPARRRAARALAVGRAAGRAARRQRSRRARATSTTCATSSARLVDGGRLLEVAPRWARNIVMRVRAPRRPLGRHRRQPAASYLGGVLDADAAQKAARFVRTCDLFGLPLVVLVDTPGLPARRTPGEGRRDPPRRQARPRVRRRRRVPKVTRRAAQGVRRRVHRDELEGPRRRPDVRLAARAARRDGPAAGGRHRAPPRDRRGRRPGTPRATGWRASTPTST